MNSLLRNSQLFIKRNASTILTIVGGAGVVGTTVLGITATPKALILIDSAKKKKGEKLTNLEKVKVAAPVYIPTIITGVATLACIFGANALNKRQQAALMSAYALLDNSYKEYRKKVKESYPEESRNFEHEIIKSKLNNVEIIDENKQLFYDIQSMRSFESTLEQVKRAEYLLNQKLFTYGTACLNDFYDFLDMDHVPYGYQLGWSTEISDKTYSESNLLEFDYDTAVLDDGLEFTIITIKCSPSLEYIC